jgi:hypothetical protein
LPDTYFVYGDCALGQKLILMEDLSEGSWSEFLEFSESKFTL